MPTIIDHIYKQIRINPKKIALICEDRKYTFADIGHIITFITKQLKEEGIRKGDRIAVLTSRSELTILLSLAIMNAEAIYIPLDAQSPKSRLLTICQNANIHTLMGEDKIIKPIVGAKKFFRTLYYSISDLNNLLLSAVDISFNKISPFSEAVAVFTSGSTGEPKGIIHSHHALYLYNTSTMEAAAIRKDDKIISAVNFCYTFSLEVFQPLIIGATLYIATSEIMLDLSLLNNYINEHAITIANMPAQMGYLFITTQKNTQLRLLIVAGGILPSLPQFPSYKILSDYGCSEGLSISAHIISPKGPNNILAQINKHVTLQIINNLGHIAQNEEEGELWISGPTVAKGYLNLPQLTNSKFIREKGKLWYRTGDKVKKLKDGNYQFAGRMDRMIKIGNQRIEPAEIEFWFSKIKQAIQVFVCLKEINNHKYLCAYYTSKNNKEIKGIRTNLSKYLPQYMIPSFFIKLQSFPLNSNGKIDSTLLPFPKELRKTYKTPANETEMALIDCVTRVLSLKQKIGLFDNFVNIGGNSVDGLYLISELRKCKIFISLQELLTAKTFRELALIHKKNQSISLYTNTKNRSVCKISPLLNYLVSHNSRESINRFIIPEFFYCKERTTLSCLHQVIKNLLQKHTMLRAQLKNNQFYIRKMYDPSIFCLKEKYLNIQPDKNNPQVKQLVNELYANIDAYNGPLFATFLVHAKDTDYILTACSHLVSDNFSKNILKQDFVALFCNKTAGKSIMPLSVRTSPYSLYTNFFPLTYPNPNKQSAITHSHYETTSIRLDESFYYKIKPLLDNKKIDLASYVLILLMKSWYQILRTKQFVFILFQHGRNISATSQDQLISFDHTIGCFPTCYKINFSFNSIHSLISNATLLYNSIKEAKHQNKDFFIKRSKSTPVFGFNYLGEIRRFYDYQNAFLSPAKNISKGIYTPDDFDMGAPLIVFMHKIDNSIILQFRYNNQIYTTDFINNLFEHIKSNILTIN